VQLGSVHEYGLAPLGVDLDEDTPARPVNTYAALKLRCTEAVTAAVLEGRIDGVTLRIGNVTGARQPRVSLLGVVADQLWRAQCDGRPAVLRLNPLGALRDFVISPTRSTRIVLAATIAELPGHLFNVGTGVATSAREIGAVTDRSQWVSTELVEESGSGQAETQWQQMCIDRARDRLGWRRFVNSNDGIKDLWENHVEMVNG